MNNWCKYCANQCLCKDDNCISCFTKSFASHPKSQFWSLKNAVTSRSVFISTNKQFIFICEICHHEFTARLGNVTHGGSWCPFCINKTERLVYRWLIENYENVKYQASFEWCKNKQKLPFDFCIMDYKVIIELDGPQHFKQISNWQNHHITQQRDKFKMQCALEHNYSVIRIKQEDVWFDRIDWKTILHNSIKIYCIPSVVIHYD